MRKNKAAVFLLILCIFAFIGAKAEGNFPGEWIVTGEILLAEGQTIALSPEDIAENTVWRSSSEAVAQVDDLGNVTAMDCGKRAQAIIEADSGAATKAWRVTVIPRSREIILTVGGEALPEGGLSIRFGESIRVSADVSPSDAVQDVVYDVSDASVASVDGNGEVTFLKPGYVKLRASSADGGAVATCRIGALVPVQEIRIEGERKVSGGQQFSMKAVTLPEDATQKTVVWRSGDEQIATVDDKGVVTTRPVDAPTTVSLYASAADGFGAEGRVGILVRPSVSSIRFTINSEPLAAQALLFDKSEIGQQIALGAVIEPQSALPNIAWASGDKGVAEITSDGMLTVKGSGECQIKVKTQDGSGVSGALYVIVGDFEKQPYYLEVDKGNQVVCVYERGENGRCKLIRRMICSTGTSDAELPDKLYTVQGAKLSWMGTILPGIYTQYSTRIYGSIWFHSLPYTGKNPDKMDAEAYAQLGEKASHGCIRLLAADAKWIYENIPSGTKLVSFSGERAEGGYGITVPTAPGGWDPTDDNPDNPDYTDTYSSLVS